MNNEEGFIELAMSVYERHKSVILIPAELLLVKDSIFPISKPKFDKFEEFASFFAYKNNGDEMRSTSKKYNSEEIERLAEYLMTDKDFVEMLSIDIDADKVVHALFNKDDNHYVRIQ